MIRKSQSKTWLLVLMVCLIGSELLGQIEGSLARPVAAKAAFAELQQLNKNIEDNKLAMIQNSRNLAEIDKQLSMVSESQNILQWIRLSNDLYQQMLADDPMQNTAFGRQQHNDENMVLGIKNMQTNLELQQLSAASVALARKRMDCLDIGRKQFEARHEFARKAYEILEKLWEFTDLPRYYDEATNREVLREFEDIGVDDPIGLLVRGLLYHRVGDYDFAEKDFTRLIQHDAWVTPVALAARGRTYHALSQSKKAREDITQARKFAREEVLVHWVLAVYFAETSEWKMAETYFQKAMASKKFSLPLHRGLALVSFERSKTRSLSKREALENAKLAQTLGGETDWQANVALAVAVAKSDKPSALELMANASGVTSGTIHEKCQVIAKAIEDDQSIDTTTLWSNH